MQYPVCYLLDAEESEYQVKRCTVVQVVLQAGADIHAGDEGLGQEMLQGVSRSFALTIPLLPPELRAVVTNAYLMCRIIDTIEDEENLSIEQKRFFFQKFVDVVAGRASASDFARSLDPLLSQRTLPAEKNLVRNAPYVVRNIAGFGTGQQRALKRCACIMAGGMEHFQGMRSVQGLKDLIQLDTYCYYVAGVVGEMLTELYCEYSAAVAQNREKLFSLAASFGQGLQMTNILKDLWDDRSRGVCWLPQDVFLHAGTVLENLKPGDGASGFYKGLCELISITRGHLENALAYTLLIPRSETGIRRFCLWSIGMAIFSLKNIYRRPTYSCGEEVKISRKVLKTIIATVDTFVQNDYLLKKLFSLATRGLPGPRASVSTRSMPISGRSEDVSNKW